MSKNIEEIITVLDNSTVICPMCNLLTCGFGSMVYDSKGSWYYWAFDGPIPDSLRCMVCLDKKYIPEYTQGICEQEIKKILRFRKSVYGKEV